MAEEIRARRSGGFAGSVAAAAGAAGSNSGRDRAVDCGVALPAFELGSEEAEAMAGAAQAGGEMAGAEHDRADSGASLTERQAEEEAARDPNGPADPQENQQRLADSRRPGNRTGGAQANPTGGGGNQRGQWDQFDPNGPLTGRDFRQWSDRLRDVEEILSEPDLRNDVARVRDRARAIRAEFTRHGKEPQWSLVEQQITKPLTELRNRIGEELAKLKPDEAIVPIDRDPVPGRFAELVRRYYENLGGDE